MIILINFDFDLYNIYEKSSFVPRFMSINLRRISHIIDYEKNTYVIGFWSPWEFYDEHMPIIKDIIKFQILSHYDIKTKSDFPILEILDLLFFSRDI